MNKYNKTFVFFNNDDDGVKYDFSSNNVVKR